MLKKLFKNSGKSSYLIISATSIICHMISYVYNIITKRYVPPYEYGIYTTANMLLLYMNYLQLGVLSAYSRDYPQLLGAKRLDEASHMKSAVFTFLYVIYMAVVLIMTAVLTIIWQLGHINTMLYVGFVVNAFLAILTIICSFWENTLKSEGHFKFPSLSLAVKTGALAVCGLLIVPKLGYYGLLVAVGVSLIACVVTYFKYFSSVKPVWDSKQISSLIKSGILLLINSLVWTMMMSIDKFVILGFMSYTELGIYSVALIGFSTLVLIPQSFSSVFYVKMAQQYGSQQDTSSMIQKVNVYTFALSIVTSIVCIGGYYILPPFISLVMPQYSQGVQSAQILVMGVAVYSSSMLFGNVFTIIKKNVLLLRNTVILCVFNVVFSAGFVVIFGEQIENVAYGTTLSYALYGVMLAVSMTKLSKCSLFKCLSNSVIPVAIAIIIMKLADTVSLDWWLKLIISGAVFTVVMLLIYFKKIRKLLNER